VHIEDIVTIIFIIIIGCWVLTLMQSHRMFYTFRKKYPEIAKKKIPNAFTRYADPEKILFFFRKENLPLFQADKKIWRLRQHTKVLFALSVGVPLLIGFLSISFCLFM